MQNLNRNENVVGGPSSNVKVSEPNVVKVEALDAWLLRKMTDTLIIVADRIYGWTILFLALIVFLFSAYYIVPWFWALFIVILKRIFGAALFIGDVPQGVKVFAEEIYQEVYPPPEKFWVKYIEYIPPSLMDLDSQIVGLVSIAIVGTFMLLFLMPFRKISYRIRGIKGESMKEGSGFCTGSIPDYQVPLYQLGLFTKTFLGYGVRIQDWLVCPQHVYHAAGGNLLLGDTIISGNAKVHSRVVTDVLYISVSIDIWSRLGVARVKSWPKDLSNDAVAISGKEGTSFGMITRSMTHSLFSYSGSTLPGYSGAAYHKNSCFYGMHIGVIQEENVGVPSLLLRKEIACICAGEDTHSSSYDQFKVKSVKIDKGYNLAAFDEQLKKAYEQPINKDFSWEDEIEEPLFDINRYKFEGATTERTDALIKYAEGLTPAEMDVLQALFSTMKNSKTQLITQNTESETVEIQVPVSPFVQMDRAMQSLKDRVSKLEEQVKELTKPLEKPKNKLDSVIADSKYQCDHCASAFKTLQGKAAHSRMIHLKGESKLDYKDNLNKIKGNGQRAFLGKSYQRPRSPILKTDLKSSNGNEVFTSLLKSQQDTQDLLKQLLNSFQKIVKDTDGLVSEKTQN